MTKGAKNLRENWEGGKGKQVRDIVIILWSQKEKRKGKVMSAHTAQWKILSEEKKLSLVLCCI